MSQEQALDLSFDIPESAADAESPSLRLVVGEGEDPAGPEDPRPDLQAVTDLEQPGTDEMQADDPDARAEDDETVPRRHLRVAAEAGARTVRRVSRDADAETVDTATYGDDAALYKSRGGGSYMRKLIMEQMAKLAAKSHPQGCACKDCDSH